MEGMNGKLLLECIIVFIIIRVYCFYYYLSVVCMHTTAILPNVELHVFYI